MHFPKVSILIPVFNREKYIAECIESALGQSFQNFEVVIVDNKSDDQTWDICQEYAKKDERVRVFQNDVNVGPVNNWLRCAKEARGEVSKILFSDDLLSKDCLLEMVPKLIDPQVAFVFCPVNIGSSLKESSEYYLHKDVKRILASSYINLVIKNEAPVSPGAILIRTKDLLHNLHSSFPSASARSYEKHGAGPDVMIMLLTLLSYSFVEYVPKPLVFFRAHKDSFSIKNLNQEITDSYRSIFSLFLMKYVGYDAWISFLSKSWANKTRNERDIINPIKFLKDYEGGGSLKEVLIFLYLGFFNLFRR